MFYREVWVVECERVRKERDRRELSGVIVSEKGGHERESEWASRERSE